MAPLSCPVIWRVLRVARSGRETGAWGRDAGEELQKGRRVRPFRRHESHAGSEVVEAERFETNRRVILRHPEFADPPDDLVVAGRTGHVDVPAEGIGLVRNVERLKLAGDLDVRSEPGLRVRR